MRRYARPLLVTLTFLSALHCGKGLGPPSPPPPVDDSTGGPVTVSNVTPSTGARGTTITLQGSGFANSTLITVGGVGCRNVNAGSSTELTCDVGFHRPGVADIVVQNAGFPPVTSAGAFTYRSFLYVANQVGATLSSFEIATNGTLTSLGPETASAARALRLALDPFGKLLYVGPTELGSAFVAYHRVDPQTGALSAETIQTLPRNARDLAFHPSGNFLVLTHTYGGTSSLSVYAISRPSGALSLVSDAQGPNSDNGIRLVLSPEGNAVYWTVENAGGFGMVYAAMNPETGALEPAAATSGTNAGGLVIQPVGNFVFGLMQAESLLASYQRTHSTGALVPVSTTPTGEAPADLKIFAHPTAPFLYGIVDSPDSGIVFSYDAATGGAALSSAGFAPGTNSGELAFGAEGAFAFVTRKTLNTVDTFEWTSDGALTARTSAICGSSPHGVVVH